MAQTLEQLAVACRQALESEPGPKGREKVRALIEGVLTDEAFLAHHLGDDVPERKVIYEDPKLGFCILAHVYTGARESQPHDHGPSPRRDGPTRLIRVEGTNMDKVKRLAYESV